ncbi:hypothetical protein GH714_010200 [Hevea brasiliensis]|uniref:Receptor ligand binding region domain-containing protein n=1 Tax=Hevea brasiliensis TaxID=3981 RepID=A0A6A6KDT1_HEVBR|nr:hypothetical protein GH714_010200 [Hevea brasiliensis]
MNKMHTFHFLFYFLALNLLCTPSAAAADGSTRTKDSNRVKGIIGAIIDESSRIGKEERLAMEIAAEDFYSHSKQSLTLHIHDSQGDPIRAALAAKELIDTQEVEAILGLQTWEEVKEMAFPTQASPNKYDQMKAVAAIVQSWNWHQVTVLYEDSMAGGVIPYLYDALREVGADIRQIISLSPFAAASSLSEDLEALQREQCRVFIVHASLHWLHAYLK